VPCPNEDLEQTEGPAVVSQERSGGVEGPRELLVLQGSCMVYYRMRKKEGGRGKNQIILH